MSAKFPKTIYVTRDDYDNGESYLLADAEQPEPEESSPCAIYQLIEVATLEVTRTLKRKKASR
jgi:hypothetical protein